MAVRQKRRLLIECAAEVRDGSGRSVRRRRHRRWLARSTQRTFHARRRSLALVLGPQGAGQRAAAQDADAVTGIAPNGCQVSQRTRTRKSLLVVLDFSFPKGKSLRCSKVPDLIGLDESTRLRHTSQKVGYKLAYCKGDWLGVLRTRKNSLDLSWRCLDGTPNVFVPHCPGTAPTVPAKRGESSFQIAG